jgi:TolB protein
VKADGSGLTRLTDSSGGATNPAWSPVDNNIAFMSSQDGSNAAVYLVRLDGSGLFRLTNEANPNSDPAWSPDGGMIAFRSYSSSSVANICVIQQNGSNPRCLTDSQWINGAPAWSPDGTRLAVRAERGGGAGIDLINVADGALESLPVSVLLKGDPIWSSDGTRLVFEGCPVTGENLSCSDNSGIELHELVLSTGEVHPLTSNSSYSGHPDWTAR